MTHKKYKNSDKAPESLRGNFGNIRLGFYEAKDMVTEDIVFCLLMWLGLSQVDRTLLRIAQEQAGTQ